MGGFTGGCARAFGLVVVGVAAVGSVAAAEPAAQPAGQPAAEPLIPPPDLNYWRKQKARWHAGAEVSVGLPVRGVLSGGYGKPHFVWAGAAAQVMTSNAFASASMAAQFQLLFLNGVVGLRRTTTFDRYIATRQANYEPIDFLDGAQPRSNYTSLDAELSGAIPAGPTVGSWSVRGMYVLDFPVGETLFSETYRIALHDNRVLMPRLGWFYVLDEKRLRVGPVGQAVLAPTRAVMVRAGGGVSYQVSTHLDAQFVLTVPVLSTDPDLGWFRQSWGVLRLSWSWATGEPAPGFF